MRLIAVVALVALSFAAAWPAQASAATAGKLTVTKLGFAQPSVDASTGSAVVNLDWTVKDSSSLATAITGDVKIRLAGPQAGTYVGLAYDIPFSLSGGTLVSASSGTAQDSTYTYAFAVPQYSFAATADWTVTEVKVQDDTGESLDLSGSSLQRYSGVLSATELVDSTPPTYDSLQLTRVIGPSRPYVFVGSGGGSSSYSFNADDAQSGFWKGVITLTGPGGKTLSANFRDVLSLVDGFGTCGAGIVFDDTSAQCQVEVNMPAGTAAGTWTVSTLQLWDNAGNHATYKNLNTLPIIVTSNAIVQASGFAANPTQVNNWTQTGTSQISMDVQGAQDGVSTIYVDFAAGNPCTEQSTTPALDPDGTYSVPVSMFSIADSCTVAGIAVVDGAGDVSVYGTEYGESDLDIHLTRVPDTTPPVATSASLSPTSIPESPDSGFVDLTINVADAIAPVTEVSATVFDSSGNIAGGGFGGVSATLNGPVVFSVPIPAGLQPGTYTVAFEITDAGGLTTFYGYPGKPPVPGGPLQFTVTP
jgi:hypothetical protein